MKIVEINQGEIVQNQCLFSLLFLVEKFNHLTEYLVGTDVKNKNYI